MNPLYVQFIGSLIRTGLATGAGYLVAHGLSTPDNAATLVTGATGILLTLGWSIFQKVTARTKLTTALAIAPTTEAKLDMTIAAGQKADPATPKVAQPTIAR